MGQGLGSRIPEEDTKPETHGEPSRQFNNQGSSHHWHLRTLEDPLIQRSHRWWYHIGSLLGINWGNCRFIKGYCYRVYLQCVCEQADLLDFCASLLFVFSGEIKLFSKAKKSKINQGLKLLHVAQNYAILWLSLLKLIFLHLTKCMNVVCYSTNKCQLSSFFFLYLWDFGQNANNIII